MRTDVARDLSDGAYDFLRVVWPAIKPKLQHGELKPVEAVAADDLKQDLDRLAGIDAWHIHYDRGLMRGIASRIQWLAPSDQPWRSFTIRMQRPNGSRTEFEKRCEAIDSPAEGWLFPHLTIQAYVAEPRRSGPLMAAGIVRTKDLYDFARQHPEREWKRNPQDGVLFTPWWWRELQDAGVRVGVVGGPIRCVSCDLPESRWDATHPLYQDGARQCPGCAEADAAEAEALAAQEPDWPPVTQPGSGLPPGLRAP